MKKTKYLKAWLIFFVVGTIGGFVAGAVVGGVAGFVLALVNGGDANAVSQKQLLFNALGFVVGIPISYVVYRWSVSSFILPQFKEQESTAAQEGEMIQP